MGLKNILLKCSFMVSILKRIALEYMVKNTLMYEC